MPKYETSSIGFKLLVNIDQCDTEEKYNAVGGTRASGLSAVVEDAIAGDIAWDWLPDWQAAFADALGKKFPARFVREVNAKATDAAKARAKNPESVKPTFETVTKSVTRFLNSATPEEKADLAKLAQEVADAHPLDPTPTQRSSGGAVNKAMAAKADDILARDEDGIEAAVTKLATMAPEFDLERDDAGRPVRASLIRFLDAAFSV